MNVLHIITGLNNGGAEAVLFRLVTADKFNTHHIISLIDFGVYGEQLTAEGISVYCLGMPRGRITLSGLVRLYNLIRQIKPEIVQTWMYHADLIGGLISRLAGVQAIVWGIRNSNLDIQKTALSTRLVARLCALISGIVPVKIISCSQVAAKVHIELSYARNKMVVIPNGYNIEQFSPNVESRDNLRRDLGVKKSEVLMGMVARWDPQKDHANFISALSLLDNMGFLSWKCVFVGPNMDPSNAQLKDLLKQFGVYDRVKLLGPHSNIPVIMKALDIHVLSSSYGEAFPNVVAEAMGCGVPCVVTDVGDARMIVDDTGWCVSPGNSIALADALKEAMRALSEGDWSERSLQCRQRIAKHFSIERMVENYTAVWENVAISKSTDKHENT
ncbi:MAG: glycosyltransferase [Methylococcaceae bacterium]